MLEEAREALSRGDTLIAYRWDPDSLAASIILGGYVRSIGGSVYYVAFSRERPDKQLVEDIAVRTRIVDSLVMVGSGWQGPELDLVAKNVFGPVLVVDNAYNYIRPRSPNLVFFNPSPRGDPRGNWVTRAFVSSIIAGDADPLLVAASIAAILGEKARAHRRFQDYMVRAGLSHLEGFEIAGLCAQRLWGITISQSPRTHASTPGSILDTGLPPCRALLEDTLLASYEVIAEDRVAELLEKPPKTRGKLLVLESEAGSQPLLLLASRREAFDTGLPTISIALEENRFSFCAWNPGRKPLAYSVGRLRRSGIGAYGVYQGLVNYVCGGARKEALDTLLSILSESI